MYAHTKRSLSQSATRIQAQAAAVAHQSYIIPVSKTSSQYLNFLRNFHKRQAVKLPEKIKSTEQIENRIRTPDVTSCSRMLTEMRKTSVKADGFKSNFKLELLPVSAALRSKLPKKLEQKKLSSPIKKGENAIKRDKLDSKPQLEMKPKVKPFDMEILKENIANSTKKHLSMKSETVEHDSHIDAVALKQQLKTKPMAKLETNSTNRLKTQLLNDNKANNTTNGVSIKTKKIQEAGLSKNCRTSPDIDEEVSNQQLKVKPMAKLETKPRTKLIAQLLSENIAYSTPKYVAMSQELQSVNKFDFKNVFGQGKYDEVQELPSQEADATTQDIQDENNDLDIDLTVSFEQHHDIKNSFETNETITKLVKQNNEYLVQTNEPTLQANSCFNSENSTTTAHSTKANGTMLSATHKMFASLNADKARRIHDRTTEKRSSLAYENAKRCQEENRIFHELRKVQTAASAAATATTAAEIETNVEKAVQQKAEEEIIAEESSTSAQTIPSRMSHVASGAVRRIIRFFRK